MDGEESNPGGDARGHPRVDGTLRRRTLQTGAAAQGQTQRSLCGRRIPARSRSRRPQIVPHHGRRIQVTRALLPFALVAPQARRRAGATPPAPAHIAPEPSAVPTSTAPSSDATAIAPIPAPTALPAEHYLPPVDALTFESDFAAFLEARDRSSDNARRSRNFSAIRATRSCSTARRHHGGRSGAGTCTKRASAPSSRPTSSGSSARSPRGPSLPRPSSPPARWWTRSSRRRTSAGAPSSGAPGRALRNASVRRSDHMEELPPRRTA